ncbi:MAG: dTDP-glucose 4,6-dehydratase [Vallitalea sp.]|jgi:dTDP-glucose 4,6-dehydratase|nr:dTDP-glucose 4,6-dehydratase [Vallitalea sp.]
MKKILVTGGAGFIGSNFIRYFMNKYNNYKIINLDALTYAGNLNNLYDIKNNSNYTFVKGNILDKQSVESIAKEGVDYIVNFAAQTHVDRSIKKSGDFVETNILGTSILLDVAKEYNIKKYIQISTDEVYGSLGKTGYFTEETSLKPNNPYSASKASADLLVMSYYKTYNLPINITRCSNNYGPYQFPEKLIPLMIYNAYNNIKLPVYGDGLNIRDWIHVEDHCRAIDLVIHKGIIGEVYNIGGNNEKTNIDIVNKILNRLGKDKSLINFVEDRLGHDYRYAIDSTKIREELSFEPKIRFEKGINDTIDWYLRNQKWLNNILK